MNDIKIVVIGGDKRQGYLAELLKEFGYGVSAYGVCERIANAPSLDAALLGADVAVLPLPVSPDGVFLSSASDEGRIRFTELLVALKKADINRIIGGGFKDGMLRQATEHGIQVYDFAQNEALMIKNALCTAEGAIQIAMKELPINIQGSSCAVIGYGRIGRLLTSRLIVLGARVTVFARRAEALAQAYSDGANTSLITALTDKIPTSDVIFNTVPSMVLNTNELATLKRDTLIIDLASSPGGVNFEEVKHLGLNAIWALSIPGKYSPKSAALIICDAITEHLAADWGDDA